MSNGLSNYYPPRAHDGILPAAWRLAVTRWGNRVLTGINRLPGPPLDWSVTWTGLLGILLIPGVAYRRAGRPGLARASVITWWSAATLLLLTAPYPWISTWAAGLLVSAHSGGIAHFHLDPHGRTGRQVPPSWGLRIGVPLATWAAVGLFLYWPVYQGIRATLVQPITVDGKRILIHPGTSPARVGRGTRILYRLEPRVYPVGLESALVGSGSGFAEVLGLPGDVVEFTPSSVRINGHPHPLAPWMPTSGKLSVAPGTWFLWPRFQFSTAMASADAIQAVHLDQSSVPQANFVGRPYKRWFFHRQSFP